MAPTSSARSMLSVIRNTVVASHLTSLCAAGAAGAAQRTGAVGAARRVGTSAHVVAAAAAAAGVGAGAGRHQLITVELISDTM
mmetsp:Transcript_34362/g.55128  ORF Transcript_34362/g.55128 Transcript_34362/m.55128 type:complete len:83 (+) Transcript_34362:312-560(+)